MTEQVNIKAESIFSKYPSTSIAAKCAMAHFTSDEAHFIVELWETLEACDSALTDFRKAPDSRGALSSFIWAIEVLAYPATGLPKSLLTLNIEKADPYATGKRLIGALAPKRGEMPAGLLRQEEASEYLFVQFGDCEVAYAAAYAGLDDGYVLDVWNTLAGHGDTEHADLLSAMVDLFGDDVLEVSPTDEALAEFMARALGLIA